MSGSGGGAPAWRRYLRFWGPDIDADIDDELRFHYEARVADFRARGHSDAEARRLAGDRLGDLQPVRRVLRRHDRRKLTRQRWNDIMEQLLQDIRYGIRSLVHAKGLSIAVIAVLALGIGANSAIFSAVDAAFFRPLPFSAPERLVRLSGLQLPMDFSGFAGPSPRKTRPELADLLGQPDMFAGAAAYATGAVNLSGEIAPVRAAITYVTDGFFPMLGRPPALGRPFSLAESEAANARVVLLSDRLWRSAFGADPGVIGRRVVLHGTLHEIVGVMPPDFRYPSAAELWAPIPLPVPSSYLGAFRNFMPSVFIARLQPGVTTAEAAARMDALRRRYREVGPDDTPVERLATPLQQSLVGERRTALIFLMGSAGLVLLIACANVMNLLLSRASTRTREVAIRAVLGGSRGRIARQLLVESLLLAIAGGVAALAVAYLAIGTLTTLLPPALAGVAPPRLDLRLCLFTFLVAGVTGLLAGVWPAIGGARVDLNDAMKGGAGGATRAATGVARSGLVVAEVALALMLLVGCGLMLQSLRALIATDAGIHADGVATAQVALPASRYVRHPERIAFIDAVLEQLRRAPGVRSAAITTALPLSPEGGISLIVRPEGAPESSEGRPGRYLMATPGYFRTLGIAVLDGTDLPARPDPAVPVAVINKTLADSLWPGERAVGRRLAMGPERRTVIGVVADVRLDSLNLQPAGQMYLPMHEQSQTYMSLIVRGDGDPRMLLPRLGEAVTAADRGQAVYNVRMMTEVLSASVAPRRASTVLLTVFGLIAMTLAAVGVYGVLSYAVTQRAREIGVRMALGANASDVVRMFLRRGMGLLMAGLVIGLAGAIALSRFMESLLYQVQARDPLVYGIAPLVLGGVALLATWLPARRAAALDPMQTLREE